MYAMKMPSKRQYILTLILLSVSLLSFLPKLTWADQENQVGTATINLSGQAIPFDTANGVSNGTDPATPAKLSLTGLVQILGTGELTMQNLTGALEIGIANYVVSNGQGDANPGGEAIIVADTNSSVDDHQLVMNGGMQGTALNFPAPSSRLTSQFFLALTGGITILDAQGSSMSAITDLSPSMTNDSYTSFANVTVSQTSTELQSNSTQFLAATANNTLTANLIQPIENGTTVVQYSNQSTTSTSNQAPTITVTVTQQVYNQTTTVSVTVAYSTITQTVTSGTTNVTIAQSTTTTVTNATTTNTTTAG